MSLQTLFDNFAVLADAPNGVTRIRELILQLAVQGRLVDNDPVDPTLMQQVISERLLTLSQLRIRKHPETAVIQRADFFYSFPSSWCALSLADLVYSCPTSYGEDALPHLVTAGVVKVGNINNQGFFKGDFSARGLRPNEFDELVARSGDLMVVKSSGSAENVHSGKTALCRAEHDGKIVGSNFVLRLRTFGGAVHPEYLWRVLSGRYSRAWVEQTVQTMTYPNLKWSDFARLPVPLPPLEEQKRIVAKVDDLMLLCDELEARQRARRESRQRLNNATLTPLNNAAYLAPEEFEQASVRLADNFARLYDCPETVARLRSTILQLAVQGKLAPQDPNDESASELYEQIRLEQTQHQSKGLYRMSKQLPPVAASERPFPLPRGWEWFRLRSLVFVLGDGLHGTPEYLRGTECYFINGNNLVNGRIVIKPHTKTVSPAEMQKHKKRMTLNTVLVSINGTLGSVGFYNNENVVLGKSACYFNLSRFVDKHFVRAVIESPYFVNYAMANATGITIRNLGLRAMNYFPVPLPPLAEQRRIVAKVNQLMALCDELETKLRQSEADSEKLLNAAVQHVLDTIAVQEKSQSETALAL